MNEKTFLCPRCEFPLVPVHAAERGQRKVVALTCPEPYCDHMQSLGHEQGRAFLTRLAGRGASKPLAGTG